MGLHRFRFRFVFSLAAVLLAFTAGHGFAQQQTAATYDNWTVRCTVHPGPPQQKTCDMEQLSYLKGTRRPFSRTVILRPRQDGPFSLTVHVPVNVWLLNDIVVQIGKDKEAHTAQFVRCVPSDCFAAIVLSDAMLSKFLADDASAEFVYTNAAQQKITIPLTFKGFGQAWAVLQKE